METLEPLTLFNLIMVCGIGVMLVAIRDIGKSNRELHAKNLRERERDNKRYAEFDNCNQA